MRILMLTQVVPNPPDAGPKVKSHYVLRSLAREHDVELVSFVRDEEEEAALHDLSRWCAAVHVVPLRRRRSIEPFYAARGWLRLRPFLVERDSRREMQRMIASRLSSGDIDVMHADQLSMAHYLPLARKHGIGSVFDAHNAVWDLVRDEAPRQRRLLLRLAAQIEWRLLRRFEGNAARMADLVLTVSREDLELLEDAAASEIRAWVVPIGVEGHGVRVAERHPEQKRLLNVSTLLYPPNADGMRWFRDSVWPLIIRDSSDAVLDIVGKRAPRDIVDWGTWDPDVVVHGYVADLDPLYDACAVYIVPLLSGSGMRVKILESMARGLPVVTTSIGAEGLDVQSGRHLVVADSPEDFANAIRELLHAPERRWKVGDAGRQLVLDRYDWRVCGEGVLDAYRAMAERRIPVLASAHNGARQRNVIPGVDEFHDRI